MDIFTCIPEAGSVKPYIKDIEYPFNINDYIDSYQLRHDHYNTSLRSQLSEKLRTDKDIYIKSCQYLLRKFYIKHQQPSFKIKLRSLNDDFHIMTINAITNFMYILEIKGWDSMISQWYHIIDNNQKMYYMSLEISQTYPSKL